MGWIIKKKKVNGRNLRLIGALMIRKVDSGFLLTVKRRLFAIKGLPVNNNNMIEFVNFYLQETVVVVICHSVFILSKD